MSSSPITARVAQLHEQWRSFTQCNEPRLLIRQAADEEKALIDAFIAKECEAESADTPDVFLQLSTPFRSDPGHGHALTSELRAMYEEASQLPVAEQSVLWRCPTSRQSTDDVDAFVNALMSLRSAAHLLRLTERHGAYSVHRRPLEKHVARLLGAAWRDQLVKAS